MKRIAILISGGGSNMVRLVESLKDHSGARVVAVGSNDPAAGGLQKAADFGIATFSTDHRQFKGDRPAFERALLAELDAVRPDILCLAGFMRILTPDFVRVFDGRMLNIHPSLLPKYPGLDTHRRAIQAGDREGGASVHLVTPELDAGPILGQVRVPIEAGDTPDRLAARVLVQEHRLYPLVLHRFLEGETDRIDLHA